MTANARIAVAALAATGLMSCCPPPADRSPDFVRLRENLVRSLRAQGAAGDRVLQAIAETPRHAFVRPEDLHLAYADRALSIGRGQTISQPYIVALMTEQLDLQGDERVLEIGTGSGYQAAVLARLARHVYTIEIDEPLAAQARERLAALGVDNVDVRAGDGFYGWPEEGPFDGIIVTAVAPRVPEKLAAQLKEGGRLVMPIEEDGGEQLIVARKRDGRVVPTPIADVRFVPMTGAVRE